MSSRQSGDTDAFQIATMLMTSLQEAPRDWVEVTDPAQVAVRDALQQIPAPYKEVSRSLFNAMFGSHPFRWIAFFVATLHQTDETARKIRS